MQSTKIPGGSGTLVYLETISQRVSELIIQILNNNDNNDDNDNDNNSNSNSNSSNDSNSSNNNDDNMLLLLEKLWSDQVTILHVITAKLSWHMQILELIGSSKA